MFTLQSGLPEPLLPWMGSQHHSPRCLRHPSHVGSMASISGQESVFRVGHPPQCLLVSPAGPTSPSSPSLPESEVLVLLGWRSRNGEWLCSREMCSFFKLCQKLFSVFPCLCDQEEVNCLKSVRARDSFLTFPQLGSSRKGVGEDTGY